MSRTAKLLLATLLVVLPGMLAVYVTLTWQPQDPWRVRLVNQQAHSVEIELENTSSVPLHVYVVMLDTSGPGARILPSQILAPVEEHPRKTRAGVMDSYPLRIPAHQVQRFRVEVNTEELKGLLPDDFPVVCSWNSVTKHRAWRSLVWLQQQLPESWRAHVTLPDLGNARLLIEQEQGHEHKPATAEGASLVP